MFNFFLFLSDFRTYEMSQESESPLGQWNHGLSSMLACLGCTLGIFNISRFAIFSIHFGGKVVWFYIWRWISKKGQSRLGRFFEINRFHNLRPIFLLHSHRLVPSIVKIHETKLYMHFLNGWVSFCPLVFAFFFLKKLLEKYFLSWFSKTVI